MQGRRGCPRVRPQQGHVSGGISALDVGALSVAERWPEFRSQASGNRSISHHWDAHARALSDSDRQLVNGVSGYCVRPPPPGTSNDLQWAAAAGAFVLYESLYVRRRG